MRKVDMIFNSMMGKGKTETYTLYDYLESDYKSQYIDTGVIVGGNSSIEIDNIWLYGNSGNYADWLCGARTALNNDDYYLRGINNSLSLRYYSDIADHSKIIAYQHYYSYQRHRNDITIYDGDTVIYHDTYTLRTSAPSYNHFLFAFNNHGDIVTLKPSYKQFKRRLGVVRIYDSNGVLVRDFHPAVRNSDGVAGMHDVLNDVFYTNANPAGDNFSYGNIT